MVRQNILMCYDVCCESLSKVLRQYEMGASLAHPIFIFQNQHQHS